MPKIPKEIEQKLIQLESRSKLKSRALVDSRSTRRKLRPSPGTPKAPRTYAGAKKLYNTPLYKEWRSKILTRDKYQCQMCGESGGELEVHHIRPKYKYPQLTLDLNNGITLCKFCHQDRVTKYEDRFYFIFDRIIRLNQRK